MPYHFLEVTYRLILYFCLRFDKLIETRTSCFLSYNSSATSYSSPLRTLLWKSHVIDFRPALPYVCRDPCQNNQRKETKVPDQQDLFNCLIHRSHFCLRAVFAATLSVFIFLNITNIGVAIFGLFFRNLFFIFAFIFRLNIFQVRFILGYKRPNFKVE